MAVHGYELEHLDAAYPEIQADTLEETIVPGLTWLVSKYDRPVMIDDSGFFVDALKGFPGVFSSYVFKTIGCEGILRLMDGRSDRSARFECCIGFMAPGDEPSITKGVAKGTVSHEMRGSGGFGYDPIFMNEGHTKTYAELDVDEKNKVSHRGKAIESFIEELPRIL
jgi:XTP/dITP diphosphohydrolase